MSKYHPDKPSGDADQFRCGHHSAWPPTCLAQRAVADCSTPLKSATSALTRHSVRRAIQEAYAVLGDTTKRQQYDTSGTWERTEEDEFRDTFAGGAFKDKVRAAEQQRQEVLTELVAVRDKESQSHSAGLEAWMRSRGENGTRIYTAGES